MLHQTNYTKTNYLFKQCKVLITCLVILFLASSCNIFEKEFKQDRHLAAYRYQLHLVPDSLNNNVERIKAYHSIINEASSDEALITPRKKNKLLSEIYNVLGGEYFEIGDMERAIAQSTLAIVLNGSNQDAFYNRACIYQTLGRDSLALLDYTKTIMYDEHYADSYYNRGIIHEKHTDFQLAIEDYSRAIKLSPHYIVDVYNNRGNVYQEMKFYDKAIADYNKALELDSTAAITYCNRADTYMKLGKADKALEDYKRAFQTDSLNIAISSKIENLKQEKKNKLALAD